MMLLEIYKGYEITEVEKSGRKFVSAMGKKYSDISALKHVIDKWVISFKPIVMYDSGWSKYYHPQLTPNSYAQLFSHYNARSAFINHHCTEDSAVTESLYLTVV